MLTIKEQMSVKDGLLMGIPPWALRFDGVNAPELGVFLPSGDYELGQRVPNPAHPEYSGTDTVVVTIIFESGEAIGVKVGD